MYSAPSSNEKYLDSVVEEPERFLPYIDKRIPKIKAAAAAAPSAPLRQKKNSGI